MCGRRKKVVFQILWMFEILWPILIIAVVIVVHAFQDPSRISTCED